MSLELIIILAIAAALLVFAVIALFSSDSPKAGRLPNGSAPPKRSGLFVERWVSPPASVPNGTEATFTFTVALAPPGQPQQNVIGREYIFVVEPRANLTILRANGAPVNADRFKAVTDGAGRIDLVIRADAPSEGPGVVLAGHTTQQIRQAKLAASFTIPGP